MKPWIGHALVWTGLIGFVALVGDTVGRVQPVEHALVIYAFLLLLLYAIAVFVSEFAIAKTPPDYKHQARVNDEAKRIADRHFGGVPRDTCTAGTADRDCRPDHGS